MTVFSIVPSPSQLYVCKRNHGKSLHEVDEEHGTVVPSVMKDAVIFHICICIRVSIISSKWGQVSTDASVQTHLALNKPAGYVEISAVFLGVVRTHLTPMCTTVLAKAVQLCSAVQ